MWTDANKYFHRATENRTYTCATRRNILSHDITSILNQDTYY